MPPPELRPFGYSLANAATKLGVGRSTIYKLIEKGEITRFYIVGKPMITDASLVAYVARQVAREQAGGPEGDAA